MTLSFRRRSGKRRQATPSPARTLPTRLHVESLEERMLLNNRFVVPLAVAADNSTTFHSLSAALTTPGLASGNFVQIEPGSIAGDVLNTTISSLGLSNLTIQGDPADGLNEIPAFALVGGATVLTNPGFTLKNVNVVLTSGDLTFGFGATGGQILGSSIISNFDPGAGQGAIALDSTRTTINGSSITNVLTTVAAGSALIGVSATAGSTNQITNNTFSTSGDQSLLAYFNGGASISVSDVVSNNVFLDGDDGSTPDLLLDSGVSGVMIRNNQFSATATTGKTIIAANVGAPSAGSSTVTIENNTIAMTSSTAGSTNVGIAINAGIVGSFTANLLNNSINTAGNGTGILFTTNAGTLNADVQGNDFHSNNIGVGITATNAATDLASGIDLGGGTQGSLGGNNFRSFTTTATVSSGAMVFESAYGTTQTVDAQHNIFASGVTPSNVVFNNGSATFAVTNSLIANPAYVQTLYTNFLGRTGNLSNANDAGFWVNALNNGASSATVANSVLRSVEALQLQVNQIFQHYLNRNADSSGLNYYVNLLQHGGTLEEVIGDVILSPEYQTQHGSNAYFIQSLYNNILGRTGTAGEISYWLNQLSTLGRLAVTKDFLASTEYRTDVVDRYYAQLLHRMPSQSEVNYWVNSGLDTLSIEVSFSASVEFQIHG